MEKIKQEAERILELFISNCRECGGIEQAKEKALICIDEIEKSLTTYAESVRFNTPSDAIFYIPDYYYWQQVKQYIIDNY